MLFKYYDAATIFGVINILHVQNSRSSGMSHWHERQFLNTMLHVNGKGGVI